MPDRLSRFLIATALVLTLANPWALLQSAAWAGMLVKFSRSMPVAQAASMTLDGQHPCGLCKAIQAAKAAQRQQSSEESQTTRELKLDLPPPSFALIHFRITPMRPDRIASPGTRAEPPRPPPPRSASAANA